MPGRNSMGPTNQGPQTGRGLGSCNKSNSQGSGCAARANMNSCKGQRFGRGFGNGFGRMNNSTIANDNNEKQMLQNRKQNLENQLEELNKLIQEQ